MGVQQQWAWAGVARGCLAGPAIIAAGLLIPAPPPSLVAIAATPLAEIVYPCLDRAAQTYQGNGQLLDLLILLLDLLVLDQY